MRNLVAFGLLVIILSASTSNAELRESRRADPKEEIAPRTLRSYFGAFKPDERARAQVFGKGRSTLGIYVFDSRGNCVSWDDNTKLQYCDELATEWVADAAGRYTIEVHNGGLESNIYLLAIH